MNEIQKLYSTIGFVETWESMLNQRETFKQTYERLESRYTEIFGERKYSSFDSFCIVKRRTKLAKKK
jgi:hypothetical protein